MGEQSSSVNTENFTADDTGNFAVSGEGGTVSFADPLLTIDGGSYTISMEEGVTSTSQRIEVTGGATVTLDGVTIDDTTDGPAITIGGSQDVTILLADGSKNVLKGKAGGSSDYGAPGIQKTDSASGWLIIGVPENSKGTGELEATEGSGAAGIGGGSQESVNNIRITGGIITTNGGNDAAGIGGGKTNGLVNQNVNNITISGGTITATGGGEADGIGAGYNSNGTVSNITITGGKVTAKAGPQGTSGSGIGGGASGKVSNITISGGIIEAYGGLGFGIGGSNASNNHIDGDNVVVIAEGGKYALEGFDSIDKGLLFTKGYETSNEWQAAMYSNSVEVNGNVEFPTSLTINTGKKLTVGSEANLTLASGATLTVADGAELANDGTISDATEASITNNGKITTKANFYLKETDETPYTSQYQTYKTGDTVGTYTNLPNPDNTKLLKSDLRGSKFLNWYYLNGSQKVAIEDGGAVLLNQHSFYENSIETYAINISQSTGGTITSNVKEAVENETVTVTVTSEEGYHFKSGSLQVKAGDTEVVISEKEDNVYTFVMPASDVVISAIFEVAPSPEPTPGTPDGWVQSDAGWQYVLNGEFLNDGWHYFEDEFGNHWYFFDADTYMATSRWIWDDNWQGWYWVCSTGPMIENLWQWIDNAWYGFWWGGKMCQGWVWDTAWQAWYYCDDYTGRVACNEWAWDGAWYYFNQNCHMLTNCWVGPYWLNASGQWV